MTTIGDQTLWRVNESHLLPSLPRTKPTSTSESRRQPSTYQQRGQLRYNSTDRSSKKKRTNPVFKSLTASLTFDNDVLRDCCHCGFSHTNAAQLSFSSTERDASKKLSECNKQPRKKLATVNVPPAKCAYLRSSMLKNSFIELDDFLNRTGKKPLSEKRKQKATKSATVRSRTEFVSFGPADEAVDWDEHLMGVVSGNTARWMVRHRMTDPGTRSRLETVVDRLYGSLDDDEYVELIRDSVSDSGGGVDVSENVEDGGQMKKKMATGQKKKWPRQQDV